MVGQTDLDGGLDVVISTLQSTCDKRHRALLEQALAKLDATLAERDEACARMKWKASATCLLETDRGARRAPVLPHTAPRFFRHATGP